VPKVYLDSLKNSKYTNSYSQRKRGV